jgi:hypothetical protein
MGISLPEADKIRGRFLVCGFAELCVFADLGDFARTLSFTATKAKDRFAQRRQDPQRRKVKNAFYCER